MGHRPSDSCFVEDHSADQILDQILSSGFVGWIVIKKFRLLDTACLFHSRQWTRAVSPAGGNDCVLCDQALRNVDNHNMHIKRMHSTQGVIFSETRDMVTLGHRQCIYLQLCLLRMCLWYKWYRGGGGLLTLLMWWKWDVWENIFL